MMARGRKPIGPGTEATYRTVLKRAFGEPPYEDSVSDLSTWASSSLKVLHAAVLKYAPERAGELPDEQYEVERVIQPATDTEIVAFERQADLLPAPRRAMVLLPLGLGLRAAEVLNIQRKSVERVLQGEDLLVVRKGGRESLLPAIGVLPLLEDLLLVKWSLSWEILSTTSERAAYQTLYRLIKETGLKAGVKGLRPHKLRHGFATRLMRAGASLPRIQDMLDHRDPATTMRYVHPDRKETEQYLPKMTGKK